MFWDVLGTHALIFLKQSARADKTWLNNFIHHTLTHKKSQAWSTYLRYVRMSESLRIFKLIMLRTFLIRPVNQ